MSAMIVKLVTTFFFPDADEDSPPPQPAVNRATRRQRKKPEIRAMDRFMASRREVPGRFLRRPMFVAT
jgi:hypothetical protein